MDYFPYNAIYKNITKVSSKIGRHVPNNLSKIMNEELTLCNVFFKKYIYKLQALKNLNICAMRRCCQEERSWVPKLKFGEKLLAEY